MEINLKKKIGIIISSGEKSGGVFQYTESILDATNGSELYDFILFHDEDVDILNKHNFSKRKLATPSYNIFQILVKLFQLLLSIRKPFFLVKKKKISFQI